MSNILRPLAAGFTALIVSLVAATGAIAADLEVTGAWARATPPGVKNGGGYMTIQNHGAADKLVGVGGDIAARIELHEHAMVGDVVKMRKVPAIEVPMHGKAELKPGGYHVMFIGLKAPLKEGAMVMIKLKFEKGGEVMVHMPVRKAAPGGMSGMEHDKKKHSH
jgi:copper(I)-binding protein